MEYDLHEPESSPPYTPPPRRSPLPWIAGAAALVLLGAAAFFYLRREDGDAAEPATAAAAPGVTEGAPVRPDVAPVDLPPLDQSDALVRQLVRALSSHPRVAAWLATEGLIRNFVVVVENISHGQTPAGHLRRLRPAGAFRVVEQNGRVLVDPRNYGRYDDLAGAVDSIDAEGAARLYRTLEPRIQEAYAELGYQQPFDAALERAIVSLLAVPVIEGGIPLEPEGADAYRFADPRIEGLTPAQKQLARMGPGNVRTIQAKLRQLAAALGFPAARLPAG